MTARPMRHGLPARALRRACGVVPVAVLVVGAVGPAAAQDARAPRPSSAFVQAGAAERAKTFVAGAAWDLAWERHVGPGTATAYVELAVGRWRSDLDDAGTATAWVTQLGATPVLRWTADRRDGRWFGEIGTGVNWVSPLYRNAEKRFSTRFNFGTHLALGRRFGDAGEHEMALRVEHFSNAGIKRPNPGDDFLQLRYAVRF